MIYTDVTFHILQYCGSYPYVLHDPYLPSSPVSLQALDRMEYAMVNVVAPPEVRIVGPHMLSLLTLPVSLDTHKKYTPGFLHLPNC